VEAEIANLRAVDWTALDLDVPILLSPPPTVPPHTEVAAAWTEPGTLDRVTGAMAERFPASPPVRVDAVLATIGGMIAGIASALSGASAAVIVAAVVVLAGSLAATWQRRVDEMVLMQTLGGSRRQIAGAAALEMAILGLATGLVAAVFGTAAAYLVVREIAPGAWSLMPAVPSPIATAAVTAMAAAGWLLPQRTLRRSPAALLRTRQVAN
jgi:putative ABC transport system permease protein